MSLVRIWLYGITLFFGLTASLCAALSIAIAGPPTDEEMDFVRDALTGAFASAGAAAGDARDDFCVRARTEGDYYSFCPRANQSAEAEPLRGVAPKPPEAATPASPPPAPERQVAAAESQLLGEPHASPRPERATEARRAERPRPRAQRAERTAPRAQRAERTAQPERPRREAQRRATERVRTRPAAPRPTPARQPEPVAEPPARAEPIVDPVAEEEAWWDEVERDYGRSSRRERERYPDDEELYEEPYEDGGYIYSPKDDW
jgi:hypothetical protein